MALSKQAREQWIQRFETGVLNALEALNVLAIDGDTSAAFAHKQLSDSYVMIYEALQENPSPDVALKLGATTFPQLN